MAFWEVGIRLGCRKCFIFSTNNKTPLVLTENNVKIVTIDKHPIQLLSHTGSLCPPSPPPLQLEKIPPCIIFLSSMRTSSTLNIPEIRSILCCYMVTSVIIRAGNRESDYINTNMLFLTPPPPPPPRLRAPLVSYIIYISIYNSIQ